MKNLEKGLQVASVTRLLAQRAIKELSPTQDAYRIARQRILCPVDYMRYAEFDAILRDLEITPGMTILDVSSPQWFSLYLANKHPNIEINYLNIIDSEIDPYKEIARALGIKNLTYRKEDVRDLRLCENTFDRVVSISVIEHIYPDKDGDLKALNEISRVLKPGGEFLLTVPFKSKGKIVYLDGPVYEREERTKNFYAREYDEVTFHKLIKLSNFSLAGLWFICERTGILSVDYYEWGPGRNILILRYLIKSLKLWERVLGISINEALAKQYLNVSREVNSRLVNISARLINTYR
jgi:ubiquinone/menaquinone biosynthesis C-methylase UbiE